MLEIIYALPLTLQKFISIIIMKNCLILRFTLYFLKRVLLILRYTFGRWEFNE